MVTLAILNWSSSSASLWCVVLNIGRVVPQHSLSSFLASSSNLTGLDSFFFKKLDSSVSC